MEKIASNQDILKRLCKEVKKSIENEESPKKVEKNLETLDLFIISNSIDFNEKHYSELINKVEKYLNYKQN